MVLSLADANSIIEGAISKANDLNIRVSVAVCDAGGRLLAFQRMDGCHWAAGYGAQGKALTSAAFAKPSRVVEELAATPIMQGIAAAEGGHMIYGQGGLPIFRDGRRIGACGVGGGTAPQDEECARAGIEGLEPLAVTSSH